LPLAIKLQHLPQLPYPPYSNVNTCSNFYIKPDSLSSPKGDKLQFTLFSIEQHLCIFDAQVHAYLLDFLTRNNIATEAAKIAVKAITLD
jgi:hypothetical protein